MPISIERAPRPERREKAERKVETLERENELARMGGITAASAEHPERNEDAFAIMEREKLVVVADGVGGRAAGEIASHFVAYELPHELAAAATAVEKLPGRELQKEWRDLIRGNILITEEEAAKKPALAAKFQGQLRDLQEYFKDMKAPREVQEMAIAMRRAMQATSEAVRELADSDPKLKDMASTVVAAKLVRGSDGRIFAVLGSVGDSMIRIRRKNGAIEAPLPSDSGMDHALARGMINEEAANPKNIKRGTFEWKLQFQAVIQALGGKSEVVPRVTITEVRPGDRLLLASDGLEDNDLDRDYERTLGEEAPGGDMTALAERMRTRAEDGIARKEGKGDDDFTAVIVEAKIPEAEEVELAEKDIEFIREEPVDESLLQNVSKETDIGAFYRALEGLNLTELRKLKEKLGEKHGARAETRKRAHLSPEEYRLKLVEEKIEEKELRS